MVIESTLWPFEIGNVIITMDKPGYVWLSNKPCRLHGQVKGYLSRYWLGRSSPAAIPCPPQASPTAEILDSIVVPSFLFPWMNCNLKGCTNIETSRNKMSGTIWNNDDSGVVAMMIDHLRELISHWRFSGRLMLWIYHGNLSVVHLPSGNDIHSLLLKMAIETVSFPIQTADLP